MRQSNTYVFLFTSLITIIAGFLLALASTALDARKDLNVAIDIKKNILRSLEFVESADAPWTTDQILTLFDEKINGFVVDDQGNIVENKQASELDPKVDSNLFPIYCRKSHSGSIEGYSIPISGKGLWSTIYGYIALEADGITIKGITFYKHGETPGLGGEVEKTWFTHNFKGKKIVDENGQLVGVQVVKGKMDPTSAEAYYQVDGISGATMTGKGLNNFLLEDLRSYEPFFKRIRSENNV